MYPHAKLANIFRMTLFIAVFTTPSAGYSQSERTGSDQTEENRFSAELSVGLQYSSKLAIDELDVVADDGDVAALLGVDLGYEFDIPGKTEFDINYSLSQSIHEELEQFDLQSHFGVANLSHDFGRVDLGLSYRYLDANLDGSGFMKYRQTAPYLTALLGNKVFVRAEYGQADRDFDTESDRDADVRSLGTDWFFFLGSPRTYVLLGYRLDRHDAFSAEHDYDQDNIKVHFVKRFNLFGNSGKFNIGIRYETRDYQDITASIGARREDERRRLRLSLELPLTDRFGTEIKYEVRDTESNLPEADRGEQVGSVEFVAKF